MAAIANAPAAVADPVGDFARDAIAGRVIVSKWGLLACERHLRDLEHGHERGIWFDYDAALDAIDIVELMPQRKGKWQGVPLMLLPWQKFRIGSFFGWKRNNGLRRFSTAYTDVPRGQGKTTEAAAVANLLFAMDGEPGAEVYSVSTKRDQAKVCWSEAKWQLDYRLDGVRLADQIGIRLLTHEMDQVSTAAVFKPLGADVNSGDSINPHAYIFDELHAWKDREYRDKLITALVKREQPVLWMITTAGRRDSIIWLEERDYAMKVLSGAIVEDRYFAWISKVDDEANWEDEREWYKANPALGVTVQIETLRAGCAKARAKPTELANWKRLHLGILAEAENPWIEQALWNSQRPQRTLEELEGADCYIGLDLSSKKDITALCAVFPDGTDAVDVFWWFWVPGESIIQRSQSENVPYDVWRDAGHIEEATDKVVDYRKVRAKIDWLREHFDVRGGASDPWNLTEVERDLKEEGFEMLEVPQSIARLSAPTKEIERLLELGGFRHGGNPVAAWMASNAVTRKDSNGNYKLDKAKSTEKIDGLAASVNAVWEMMETRLDNTGEVGLFFA